MYCVDYTVNIQPIHIIDTPNSKNPLMYNFNIKLEVFLFVCLLVDKDFL